jgi:uncharacterized membrane protein YdjX (TVP38/TMEM64 family)
MRWRIYAIVAAIAAIMLASLLFVGDAIDRHFEGPEGLDRLRSYGDWAWLAAIGLIISDLILPVPGTTVIALLGMLYGPWLGGFIGGVGTLLAGLVAYGGCRLLGDRFVRFLVGETNLGRLQTFFARHGLWAIALTRWMPLLPEVLCCLAGMSRMRFWPVFLALACGSFPMGFTFALLGQAYLDRPVTGMVISAMIPLVVWPPVHYLVRRRPARAGGPAAPADLGGLPPVRVTSDDPASRTVDQ